MDKLKEYLHMWEIGKKILDADQKLIIGKTFEEIAEVLNIPEEDILKHIEFMKIGKFAREVSEKQSYEALSKEKKEVFLKFLMSKSIYDGKMPRTFFRYTRINEKIISSINESFFSFSSLTKFSDPFEGIEIKDYSDINDESIKKHLDYINEKFKTILNHKEISQENYKEKLKQSTDGARNNLLILCLTTEPDNNLMWAHYSDGGKGICIEMDPFADPLFFSNLIKVDYVDDYPKEKFSQTTLINNSDPKYFKIIAATKEKIWEYEKEWRIIKVNGNKEQKFNKDIIKSIIFGLRIPPEDKEKIKRVLSIENGYGNVEFRQIVKIAGTFQLKIVDDI